MVAAVLLLGASAAGVMAQTRKQAAKRAAADPQVISLKGEWAFAQGDEPAYDDVVTLPGSMLTNGKGDEVSVRTQWTGSLYDSSFFYNPYMEKYRKEGKMKFPFFLTPDKHYVGCAWYKKVVRVPKTWEKKSVTLFLERPHIETAVYVNGQLAGRDSSLSVPHEFDITPYVAFGSDNEIAIRVYNGIEHVCVGQDSHSVTDQTQGNWNGLAGEMHLKARQREHIENVQVYPDVQNKKVVVVMDMAGERERYNMWFLVTDEGDMTSRRHDFKKLRRNADGKVRVALPMGDGMKTWDEFHPNLYRLTAVVGEDTVSAVFGMSRLSIEGRQFYMNGKPIWMRGTVENCCFPETGYPPTDEESWLRIFRKCKEYGLNMMRFHSFCPPEAAFSAADKVGFYLQPEGPSWPNHGVKLGNGMNIDRYLLEETQRMVRQYGNHPSFCMLAAGNEPAGNWVKWVGDFVDYWRATGDKRRVYCGASVGGGWAWDAKSEYHVKGGARGLDWNNRQPQSADDFNESVLKVTQKGKTPVTFDVNEPLLAHEMGQWCAFPDLKERDQYTGVYKAANFDIFEDLLRDGGMAGRAEAFLHASGKLQTLAYKYDIERNLRTRDYAGFQLLGLNDYSGQGTALVGVLNVHWKEKGYCDAQAWRQFCSPVVPLARFPKFVYGSGDTLCVPVELYNAYTEGLDDVEASYVISGDDGHVYASGKLSAVCADCHEACACCKCHEACDCGRRLEAGKNIDLGKVTSALDWCDEPVKLTMRVEVKASNMKATVGDGAAKELLGTDGVAANSWEFWVYPSKLDMPDAKGIYVADTLDAKARSVLRKGGKVLLLAAGKVSLGADVKQTYLPVFWNTSWFKMRPPHTTGVAIDKAHPLFKRFLTDDWANLNWWELVNKAQVMNLCELPASYQPAIQPIDTWHVSRKLGMMVEANVLGGKLLMTTMDLSRDLDRRLVARLMRMAVIEYMQSADFVPALTLDAETVNDFFTKAAPAVNMFTNDSPDELKPKLK